MRACLGGVRFLLPMINTVLLLLLLPLLFDFALCSFSPCFLVSTVIWILLNHRMHPVPWATWTGCATCTSCEGSLHHVASHLALYMLPVA